MKASRVTCPNAGCDLQGRVLAGNIALHGYSKVKSGRRRRYRCKLCGVTFGATSGTPYKRLQHSMRRFDRVAALSVEGVSKSAIARLEGVAWNTVARWLERAAGVAKAFNERRTLGIELIELQLDELSTPLQSRKRKSWVFAGIEVWSRLWLGTRVGPRTYRNTIRFLRSVTSAGSLGGLPLITTDGFKFYAPVIRRVFSGRCLLGQVIKKVRKNRVVRIGTTSVIGSDDEIADALELSEDSTQLNTSFIERLNLTIRQGSAFLRRRSPCHARRRRTLADHLELLRCHYNFGRPHRSLRFGSVTRTPAMQAGIATRVLRFRDVFRAGVATVRFTVVGWASPGYHRGGAAVLTAA